MEISGVEYKYLKAYDGTQIRYQVIGTGPTIVFANGLGGTFEAWYYILEHLKKNFQIISWDYRGLYGSGRPSLSRVSIADHVQDLNDILKAEKVTNALLAGWSMGTQVIFEYYVRHPKQVLGLIPICGASGAPFDTALYTSLSRYLMPALFMAQKKLAKPFEFLIKRLIQIPGGFDAITATRLFWKSGEEVIRDLVDDFAQLDFETYAQIMLELGRHDARANLPQVKVPTLIIGATGDFFTPIKVSEFMKDTIPDAQLYVLDGATHYAPLEFPDKINELIDVFIEEKIHWPKPKSAKKK